MPDFFKISVTLLIPALAATGLAAPARAAPGDRISTRIAVHTEQRGGKTLYCVSQAEAGPVAPMKTCRTREKWNAIRASATTAPRLAQRN